MHYKEGLGSCSCEDHCGWDLCRLSVAPPECIIGTFSEWQWDYVKKAWVAQVIQGNIVLITIKILKILICKTHSKLINYLFFQDPYEYFEGCYQARRGYCIGEGKRCVSDNQCTNCTFGKCIQLAKEKDSEAFSYSKLPNGTSACKLCTTEQLGTLQTEAQWAVYKKSGNWKVFC